MPAVTDPLIELLERDARIGIGVELNVSAQRLRNTLVLVMKDRWQRSEKMSCKNDAFGIGRSNASFSTSR